MKELALYVLALMFGLALLPLSVSYYENAKSAQKIENLKNLYELKSDLQNKYSSKQTEQWIKETQIKIDSINNL